MTLSLEQSHVLVFNVLNAALERLKLIVVGCIFVCFLKEFLVLLFCRGCHLDFVYRRFLLRLVQDIGHVLRVWILFCLFKTVHIICPPLRAKAIHLRVLRTSKLKLATV